MEDDRPSDSLQSLLREAADLLCGCPDSEVAYDCADRLLDAANDADASTHGAAEYDRELIARMLATCESCDFTRDGMDEQVRLLREADNRDAAGVRTGTNTAATGMGDWVLVPRTITPEMEDAADMRDDDEPASDWGKSVDASRQAIWDAMIAAAPTALAAQPAPVDHPALQVPCKHCGAVGMCPEPFKCVSASAAEAQPAPVVGGNARLEELAYVPGAWRCPKCGLRLIAQTLHVQDGGMSANNEPQACANGCGSMWRVTEREDRQEAQRFAIEQSDKLNALLSARPGGDDPIGWVFQHDETGRTTFCPNDGVNNPDSFAANNPRFVLTGPAYAHPARAGGEDARDAARYRWLRGRAWISSGSYYFSGPPYGGTVTLDLAIDKALSSGAEGA